MPLMSLFQRIISVFTEGRSKAPWRSADQITNAEFEKGSRPSDVKWAVWFGALKAWNKARKKKAKASVGYSPSTSSKPKGESPLANLNPAYVAKKKAEKEAARKAKVPDLVHAAIARWASSRSYAKDYTWIPLLEKSIAKGKVPEVADWLKVQTDPPGMKILKAKGLDYFTKSKIAKLLNLLPDKGTDDDWGDTQQMGWWGVGGKKKHHSNASFPKSLPKPVLTPEQLKLRQLRKSVGTLDRDAAGGVVFKSFEAPSVDELLVLVSQVHPKYGSYWVFPKGGVDIGESLHQGAAREVREEAGVKAKVIPGTPFVHTSTFGESGKYDFPLVMQALLKKNPADKEFIKANEDAFRGGSFTYRNVSHYYVMQHTGGRPRSRPGKDQEMNKSEWVTVAEAMKRHHRMKKVLEGLMPQIKKRWRPGPPTGRVTLADLAGDRRAG